MEKEALNKSTKNFDDIELKKINLFNSSLDKDNDIRAKSQKQNTFIFNPPNFQNSISIMDKTNEFFKSKLDNYKQFEERKNIDFDKYQDLKEKSISSKNFSNNTTENNRLNSNVNSNKVIDKNNIKEILNQNKNIINKINNIMNNNLNDKKAKTKFDYSKDQNNIYLENKNNIISNIEKDNKNDIQNKKESKTFFNYNEEYQNKMGGKDRYLENIQKFNEEKNANIDNKSNNSLTEPMKYTPNYTFGKNETNMKNESLSNFNIKKDIISKDINEISKIYKQPLNTYSNKYNNLIDRKEYNFNYRSNDSFNNINKTGIQQIENKIDIKVNNYPENKSNLSLNDNYNLNNEYLSKINNGNGLKYNNYLKNNDFAIKTNNYLLDNENKFSSLLNSKNLSEKEIKMEIGNKEKNILKGRPELISNEINKRENIYNNGQVENIKKEESQIKPLTPAKYNDNYNITINDNFYKDFLKEIKNKDAIINKSSLYGITNNTQKKKSLSVGNKQIEIKDYINNYSSIYKNNEYKSDINNNIFNRNNNLENEYNLYKDKETEIKTNPNSFFQLQDKVNYTQNNNINNNLFYKLNSFNGKTKISQNLSSYLDETIKNNDEAITKNSGPETIKNYQISLTPNGLYRNNKIDNNLFNIINSGSNNYTNLIYHKNYSNKDNNYNMRDEIVKTLSTNNYNSMTQTRFYRNRDFPELNYDNEKLTTLNTMKDYNIKSYLNKNFKKQNSSRSFSHLNFDLEQDYINNYNNYIPNSQKNILINSNYNTLTNNSRNNNILYQSNTCRNKLNSYRCKCTLRKGKSYNDFTKLFENNKNGNNINDSLKRNFRINKDEYYGVSSNIIKRNNYNSLVYNTFSQNNNSFNYHNSNQRNICEKCNRTHYNNENNINIGNVFRNCNTLRLCNTCKNLIRDGNLNKRNNNFLFV